MSANCQRCKSERLYAFEADRTVRSHPGALPVVCRDCGLITIDGAIANFPEAFEEQARSMAELAATAGQDAVQELRGKPDTKIATYFSRVYKAAYLDGFWRAVAFLKHEAKEGRLIRLRDLWQRRRVLVPQMQGRTEQWAVLEMPETVYAEFTRLLELGSNDGPRSENQRPPAP